MSGPFESVPSPTRSPCYWAAVGLAVGIALIVLKFVGYLATNSAAVLSDALESLVNIVTSSVALYSVWLSSRPHDHNHPYGHGKVEYFSATLEGLFVGAAGLGALTIGVLRLLRPQELPHIELGAAIELGAGVIALIAGTMILRAGDRLESPTIAADGRHIRADAITSFGAFIGASLVALTGIALFDALAALGIGLFLIYEGSNVVRRAVAGLMDEADPCLLDRIAAAMVRVRRPGWIAPHAVKVHRLGQAIHVDLHLVFPRFWTIEVAHGASHDLVDALREEFGPRTDVMVHNEPCEDAQCAFCDLEDCAIRKAPLGDPISWTGADISRRPRPEAPVCHGATEGRR